MDMKFIVSIMMLLLMVLLSAKQIMESSGRSLKISLLVGPVGAMGIFYFMKGSMKTGLSLMSLELTVFAIGGFIITLMILAVLEKVDQVGKHSRLEREFKERL